MIMPAFIIITYFLISLILTKFYIRWFNYWIEGRTRRNIAMEKYPVWAYYFDRARDLSHYPGPLFTAIGIFLLWPLAITIPLFIHLGKANKQINKGIDYIIREATDPKNNVKELN